MIIRFLYKGKRNKERGSFLLEMLVAISISAIIMTSASDMMLNNMQSSLDSEIMMETETKARAILDLMTFDLRMIGAGIPFDQEDFNMSDPDVGAAALPVYTDTTAGYLHFRINELGKDAFLTTSFDPDSSSTIAVDSVADLAQGDIIYISDQTAGGSDGLQATISSISYPSVTLTNLIYPDGASFPTGSIINRVMELEYVSSNDDTGIVRNNGYGDVVLTPHSTFTVSYLDLDGNAIALPLTADTIENNLAAIDISVQVTSSKPLRSGTSFTTTSTGRVTIRSLTN